MTKDNSIWSPQSSPLTDIYSNKTWFKTVQLEVSTASDHHCTDRILTRLYICAVDIGLQIGFEQDSIDDSSISSSAYASDAGCFRWMRVMRIRRHHWIRQSHQLSSTAPFLSEIVTKVQFEPHISTLNQVGQPTLWWDQLDCCAQIW